LFGPISDIFDLLKTDTSESLSIDQISQVVAAGWAGKR